MEKKDRVVVVDNVRSMHNVGSIFRTADAFAWKKIILCGISGCPPHPELHKTALGAELSVDWEHKANVIDAIEELRREGYKICVLEQAHDSMNLYEFKAASSEKFALVVGNEVEGVNQGVVDKADYILEIEQRGTKHSLNVAVSAGMAIFQMSKIE